MFVYVCEDKGWGECCQCESQIDGSKECEEFGREKLGIILINTDCLDGAGDVLHKFP